MVKDFIALNKVIPITDDDDDDNVPSSKFINIPLSFFRWIFLTFDTFVHTQK